MSRSVEFWSSVELGSFARGLLRELTAAGWHAEQRFEFAESDYREARNPAARARMRWHSYVTYLRTLGRRLRDQAAPTAIVVCTNTFYAPAVALQAARRVSIPVVHWVFDLFPDVLVAGDKVRAGSLTERCLGRLTRWTFQHAAANVFLGERLLEHAVSRYGPIPRNLVIPVGADGELFRTDSPHQRSSDQPLRVLYCGNLGRMHETDTIAELFRRGMPAGFKFEFRGHGAGFRSLAATIAGATDDIVFGNSLNDAEWTQSMRRADIALVTMKHGAEGLVMPSKTYSAMAAGQAILAICPRNSDLAETVRRHDAGWVIEPGDTSGLERVLSMARAQPTQVLAKRSNAFRAGHQEYDQKVLATRWIDLLTSISGVHQSS